MNLETPEVPEWQKAGLLAPVEMTMFPSDPVTSPRVQLLLGATDSMRSEAALKVLAEGREDPELVAENTPLGKKTTTALLEADPDTLETILERLWAARSSAVRRAERSSDVDIDGVHKALVRHGGEARIAAEVLDSWEGTVYYEYRRAVELFEGSIERLETYLVLLEDDDHWNDSTPTESSLTGKRAAEAAAALHP